MNSSPYDELRELDRAKLHVFVAGPGQGEAIAVALPQLGWVLVDSCKADRAVGGTQFPLISILKRHKRADDPLRALILTHPHRDHAEGFARLVEAFPPECIGVVGCPAPGRHLLDEASDWIAAEAAVTGKDVVKLGAVRSALAAIREFERKHPGKLLVLHDGSLIPVPGTPAGVEVRVIAPDRMQLGAFWGASSSQEKFSSRANYLSLACRIRFGETRVLLGGDLPHTHNGAVVKTGWATVANTYADLSQHRGAKVPHHGSREALHASWMGAVSSDRCWCVSPFNSSDLPGLAAGEGLDQMLAVEKSVRLTSVPAAREVQAAHPAARITLSQLTYRRDQMRTGVPFVDNGIDIKPGSACGPEDGIWAFAFDDKDRLVTAWRGSGALEVEREPKPLPGNVVVRRKR